MKESESHHWVFFRNGGLDQVVIEKGADIAHLGELDQKLWVVLACPAKGLEFDGRTLELIDSAKDGRIRIREVVSAVEWAAVRLRDPATLLKGEKALPLAEINTVSLEGAKLLIGARHMLVSLGKNNAATISLEDVADFSKSFVQHRLNGDGVVPPESAVDGAVAKAIADMVACTGGVIDRNGRPGINRALLETFLKEAAAYVAWHAGTEARPEILPLGPQTAAAYAAFAAIRAKVEDHFARCRLAAFDGRSVAALECTEAGFAAFAAKSLTSGTEEISRLPLARVTGSAVLPLTEGLNPGWQAAVAAFRQTVAEPWFGTGCTVISEAQWQLTVSRFQPYEAWQAAKAGASVEKLGLVRVQDLLDGQAAAMISALIDEDLALQPAFDQIGDLEKLIRFYHDLVIFLRNFVNFADFYALNRNAIFQIGHLYMDGRVCELCFPVDDVGKHSMFAGNSRIFLAYCEVSRPGTGEKKMVCAAFTAGTSEALWVGRNGIFYDCQGNDWDAVIVKVIENPISLREAFWMPWKKIVSMVGEQVKKILAAREAAAMNAATKQIEHSSTQVAAAAAGHPPPPPPPPPPKLDGAALASSVAAVGIAVGLIGSAFGGLLAALSSMPLWKVLLGIGGIFMLVSGPAVLLAYFKMRTRDIAPILNACGWAVNGNIRMTLSLGSRMTHAAELPEGAERRLIDPYADSRWREYLMVIVLAFLGLLFGIWKLYVNDYLDSWIPERWQHGTSAQTSAAEIRRQNVARMAEFLCRKEGDVNQDGRLDESEAKEIEAKQLKDYDADKNGRLDAKEKNTWRRNIEANLLKNYDADKNGALDEDEYTAMCYAAGKAGYPPGTAKDKSKPELKAE